MIKNILFQWMKMGINWLRVTSMNVMENGTGQNTAITLPPIIPTSSGLHLIESYLMQTVENSNFYVHFLMKISFSYYKVGHVRFRNKNFLNLYGACLLINLLKTNDENYN